MGVKDLKNFMETFFGKEKDFKMLDGTSLAIDLSIWIQQFLSYCSKDTPTGVEQQIYSIYGMKSNPTTSGNRLANYHGLEVGAWWQYIDGRIDRCVLKVSSQNNANNKSPILQQQDLQSLLSQLDEEQSMADPQVVSLVKNFTNDNMLVLDVVM